MILDSDTIGGYIVQKHPWYSPHFVILAAGKLIKMYGSNIESKGEFKIAREMFEGAVALLGAYELDPSNKYYLQPNLQSDSPDIVAVKQTELIDQPILLEITQLEIVSMNEYSPTDDVIEFLKKTKLSSKKSYNDKTIIVCVVNKKIRVDRVKIAEDLNKIRPQSTVYILGKLRSNDQWTIFSPYPRPTKYIIYSLAETMSKYQLPSPMRLFRSTNKKISIVKSKNEKTTIFDVFNIQKSKIEKYKTS